MNHYAHKEHYDTMPKDLPRDSRENIVSSKIFDSAYKIHRQYGPGLLESAYQKLLAYELVNTQNLKIKSEKIIPLTHEAIKIDAGYRIDLLVEDCVILELKCVEKLLPIHEAQLITYLKLSGIRLGFLMNFNSRLLKNGIKRIIV